MFFFFIHCPRVVRDTTDEGGRDTKMSYTGRHTLDDNERSLHESIKCKSFTAGTIPT